MNGDFFLYSFICAFPSATTITKKKEDKELKSLGHN